MPDHRGARRAREPVPILRRIASGLLHLQPHRGRLRLLANHTQFLGFSQILVQAPSVKDRFLALRARSRDQSRRSATGRYGAFPEPSTNGRCLRTPAIAGPSWEDKNPPLRDIPRHRIILSLSKQSLTLLSPVPVDLGLMRRFSLRVPETESHNSQSQRLRPARAVHATLMRPWHRAKQCQARRSSATLAQLSANVTYTVCCFVRALARRLGPPGSGPHRGRGRGPNAMSLAATGTPSLSTPPSLGVA
jgi:hypothetical protein